MPIHMDDRCPARMRIPAPPRIARGCVPWGGGGLRPRGCSSSAARVGCADRQAVSRTRARSRRRPAGRRRGGLSGAPAARPPPTRRLSPLPPQCCSLAGRAAHPPSAAVAPAPPQTLPFTCFQPPHPPPPLPPPPAPLSRLSLFPPPPPSFPPRSRTSIPLAPGARCRWPWTCLPRRRRPPPPPVVGATAPPFVPYPLPPAAEPPTSAVR